MKHYKDQLEFINKQLLPIFRIKCLWDYTSNFCKKDITPDKIQQLNKLIPQFKNIFPVREFSIQKLNKITTSTQAYNLIKKCLLFANILFC